jgi:hypothetical protein
VGKATSVKLLLEGTVLVRIAGSRENFLSSLLSLFSLACFSLVWLVAAREIRYRKKKEKKREERCKPFCYTGFLSKLSSISRLKEVEGS